MRAPAHDLLLIDCGQSLRIHKCDVYRVRFVSDCVLALWPIHMRTVRLVHCACAVERLHSRELISCTSGWPGLVPGLEQPRSPGSRARAWDSPGTSPEHPGAAKFPQNRAKKAVEGANQHTKSPQSAKGPRSGPFSPPGAALLEAPRSTPEQPKKRPAGLWRPRIGAFGAP
jgi:hypothetical protein